MEWMIEHFRLKIRTHDHALRIPQLAPQKNQRLEPMTMHYTTIDDPEKTKIRNPQHALHQHWLPQSQRFTLSGLMQLHHMTSSTYEY
jgi:hypothetical protein